MARRHSLGGRLPKGGGPEGGGLEPSDLQRTLTSDEVAMLEEARPYTMTSTERMLATTDAISYIARRDGLDGALVECGVWRGGMVLLMIRTLQRLGLDDRDVFLYDTFSGMTRPESVDTSEFDRDALDDWEDAQRKGEQPWGWVFGSEAFSLERVQDSIGQTGYPEHRAHFVGGPVEETIPGSMPERIAVLRLDTDWYSSTRHELEHLYPRLSDGGVLLIDDYGHWRGARRAVDEYFSDVAEPLLLGR